MKITELDRQTFDALLDVGNEIYDIYEQMSIEGIDKESLNRLELLFKKEDMLYGSLNLNRKKANAIRMYFEDRNSIEVSKYLPAILNDDFDITTYSIYRIIARCKYLTSKEIVTLEIGINSVKQELYDMETMMTYISCMKTSESLSEEVKEKLRHRAYLSLIDSEWCEKYLLSTSYDIPNMVNNSVYFAVNLMIERQKAIMSKAKNMEFIIVDSDYIETYNKLIIYRINGIFNGLLFAIVDFYKYCSGLCDGDLYYYILSYLKALVSLVDKKTRLNLYNTLSKKIHTEESDPVTKKLLLDLLKSSIEDIETELSPSIVFLSTYQK